LTDFVTASNQLYLNLFILSLFTLNTNSMKIIMCLACVQPLISS